MIIKISKQEIVEAGSLYNAIKNKNLTGFKIVFITQSPNSSHVIIKIGGIRHELNKTNANTDSTVYCDNDNGDI